MTYELTRIHDAVVELCAGWVTETTDSTKANGTLGWGQNVLAPCLALSERSETISVDYHSPG